MAASGKGILKQTKINLRPSLMKFSRSNLSERDSSENLSEGLDEFPPLPSQSQLPSLQIDVQLWSNSLHSRTDMSDRPNSVRDNQDPKSTWAAMANKDCSKCFLSSIPMLDHTPKVNPVFIHYKRISSEGYKIPLIDVAIAAGKVVKDQNVDAVQPMRNGWQIYVKTEVDHAALIVGGIDIAGQHVSLESRQALNQSVKIVVKDL